MPKDFPRTERIAHQIQRELARLIGSELKDPRVRMLTIIDVMVSKDYAHAKVFYTTLGAPADHAEISKGLQRATGFLRSRLAHCLKLRSVPQLHFVYDTSVERGARLSKIIENAVQFERK